MFVYEAIFLLGIFFVNITHVRASVTSLALTFTHSEKSQVALVLLPFLSKLNPLRWAAVWVFECARVSILSTYPTSEQSLLCSDVFYAYGKKDVIRPLPW